MKVTLDISVPSGLWRALPRARALARETIAAAVAESELVATIDNSAPEWPLAPPPPLWAREEVGGRTDPATPNVPLDIYHVQQIPGDGSATPLPNLPHKGGGGWEFGARTAQSRLAVDRQGGRVSFETLQGAEVSLCLADDAQLQALNLRWRGLDKPTNVLSFPAAPHGRRAEPFPLGDIALAYQTLAREASELGVPLADHYRHLVAHGFLHLIGYDHETAEEAERMEALESRIMARLGVADPYARELANG